MAGAGELESAFVSHLEGDLYNLSSVFTPACFKTGIDEKEALRKVFYELGTQGMLHVRLSQAQLRELRVLPTASGCAGSASPPRAFEVPDG